MYYKWNQIIKNIKVKVDREYIKELLESNNMTQRALAEAIGVSEALISHYINNRAEPSLTVIYRMAMLFNVDIEDLLKEVR